MEEFSEEYSKLLSSKEWLVKIDNQKSTPYLFKFCLSTINLKCIVLVTDTKSVWTEVLTSQQMARRWRTFNPTIGPSHLSGADEEEWRSNQIELLTNAHTIGAFSDASFNIVESRYSDIAFELDYGTFKWKWETNFLGHKMSAELISKHLIAPLISATHLAFSSSDSVSNLSDGDLEKAIDKVGKTARRTFDTHVRNVISKPRVATTLRRMSALLNFIPQLPDVDSIDSKQRDLQVLYPERPAPSPPKAHSPSPIIVHKREVSPLPADKKQPKPKPRRKSPETPSHEPRTVPASSKPRDTSPAAKPVSEEEHSLTESEDDDLPPTLPPSQYKGKAKVPIVNTPPPPPVIEEDTDMRSPSPASAPPPSKASGPSRKARDSSSDSDFFPVRLPPKKKKVANSSGSDSEDAQKPKPKGGASARRGGTRQPVKRGGRKF